LYPWNVPFIPTLAMVLWHDLRSRSKRWSSYQRALTLLKPNEVYLYYYYLASTLFFIRRNSMPLNKYQSKKRVDIYNSKGEESWIIDLCQSQSFGVWWETSVSSFPLHESNPRQRYHWELLQHLSSDILRRQGLGCRMADLTFISCHCRLLNSFSVLPLEWAINGGQIHKINSQSLWVVNIFVLSFPIRNWFIPSLNDCGHQEAEAQATWTK